MENQEQKLIDEICALFKELIEEENERYDIPTKRTIYPRNFVYVSKAKELFAKAVELEKIDTKYSTHELKTVFNKELYCVDHHEYKYKKDSLTPTGKSISELQNFMHNATCNIRRYLFDILGDIKIDRTCKTYNQPPLCKVKYETIL